MITHFQHQRPTLTYRILSTLIVAVFTFSVIAPPAPVYAQLFPQGLANLPLPGTMVPMSPGFTPAIVRGITIHPDNPLMFDFIVDKGDTKLAGSALEEESIKLIKYFLATLTVPEDELWVNLSPYESDRIISGNFGQTEMGRDLLAQDYMLKQLSASLMYPENDLGNEFWNRVYERAQEEFGTTDIPMNTFNKIWIVPETAVVFEHESSAYVVESHLKVMLEEDYVALQKNLGSEKYGMEEMMQAEAEVISGVSSEVVRKILIPEIENEVNQGETFANLRQIYNSMILATWYKKNLHESLLGQVYVDQNKTKGVDVADKEINQKIYNQYLEAFKKGVFNYIKEDYDPTTQQIIPRKYFSGGVKFDIKKIFKDGNEMVKLTPERFIKFLHALDSEKLSPDSARKLIAKRNTFNSKGRKACDAALRNEALKKIRFRLDEFSEDGLEERYKPGFIARLSDPMAEPQEMWLRVNAGNNPFRINEKGEEILRLDPKLLEMSFATEPTMIDFQNRKSISLPGNTYAFEFLGGLVVYYNPKRKNTYGADAAVMGKIVVQDNDGNRFEFPDGIIDNSNIIKKFKNRKIVQTDVYFDEAETTSGIGQVSLPLGEEDRAELEKELAMLEREKEPLKEKLSDLEYKVNLREKLTSAEKIEGGTLLNKITELDEKISEIKKQLEGTTLSDIDRASSPLRERKRAKLEKKQLPPGERKEQQRDVFVQKFLLAGGDLAGEVSKEEEEMIINIAFLLAAEMSEQEASEIIFDTPYKKEDIVSDTIDFNKMGKDEFSKFMWIVISRFYEKSRWPDKWLEGVDLSKSALIKNFGANSIDNLLDVAKALSTDQDIQKWKKRLISLEKNIKFRSRFKLFKTDPNMVKKELLLIKRLLLIINRNGTLSGNEMPLLGVWKISDSGENKETEINKLELLIESLKKGDINAMRELLSAFISRAEKNPDLFHSINRDQRSKIKAELVEYGMTYPNVTIREETWDVLKILGMTNRESTEILNNQWMSFVGIENKEHADNRLVSLGFLKIRGTDDVFYKLVDYLKSENIKKEDKRVLVGITTCLGQLYEIVQQEEEEGSVDVKRIKKVVQAFLKEMLGTIVTYLEKRDLLSQALQETYSSYDVKMTGYTLNDWVDIDDFKKAIRGMNSEISDNVIDDIGRKALEILLSIRGKNHGPEELISNGLFRKKDLILKEGPDSVEANRATLITVSVLKVLEISIKEDKLPEESTTLQDRILSGIQLENKDNKILNRLGEDKLVLLKSLIETHLNVSETHALVGMIKEELGKKKPGVPGESGKASSPLYPEETDTSTKGGIDLNPAMMDLQIKRDGNGVPLPVFQQPLDMINIKGFVPVIINVTPVIASPFLLGLLDGKEGEDGRSDLSYLNLSALDVRRKKPQV